MKHFDLIALLAVASSVPAQAATLAEMKGRNRILIVAAPGPNDPQLADQRNLLAGWQQGAAERDVRTVELVGDATSGVDDKAASLRRRFDLPTERFAVLLIGKDGHVALRAPAPLAAQRLESAIDAMPMRRAGQR